jgi:hypothetical protein
MVITEELLDIVAGFEALSGKEKKPAKSKIMKGGL